MNLSEKEKEKLIDHLSKEIEVQNNNMMTFRTRANLPVFLGPFVLLGSVVIGEKRVPRGLHLDPVSIIALVGLAASYLLMGLAAARIELLMSRQCNKWRSLITKTVGGTLDEKDIESDLEFDPISYRGYAAVYSAMFGAFICALLVILKLTFAS